MIPIHRWVRPFGTHLDDLADALPPSHFPTPSQPFNPEIPSGELRQWLARFRGLRDWRSGKSEMAWAVGPTGGPDLGRVLEAQEESRCRGKVNTNRS